MNTSFVKRPEVISAYLGTLGFNAIMHTAQSAPKEAAPSSGRIGVLLDALTTCKEGHENSGILRVALGGLAESQLALTEKAVSSLHGRQLEHEARHGKFKMPRQHGSVKEDFRSRFEIDPLPSPYEYVVRALLPEFQEAVLTAFALFPETHQDLSTLASLCIIMDEQGIPLTQANVILQMSAFHKWNTTAGLLNFGAPRYVSNPALIRAVHKHPTKVNALIMMMHKRGSVEAFDEVNASAPAISEGAL